MLTKKRALRAFVGGVWHPASAAAICYLLTALICVVSHFDLDFDFHKNKLESGLYPPPVATLTVSEPFSASRGHLCVLLVLGLCVTFMWRRGSIVT